MIGRDSFRRARFALRQPSLDEHTRRGLWIECARHLTSVDVVRVLEQLVELHGAPTTIKSDNGPEFVAKKVQQWIEGREIGARFIEPGSPWQTGPTPRI